MYQANQNSCYIMDSILPSNKMSLDSLTPALTVRNTFRGNKTPGLGN